MPGQEDGNPIPAPNLPRSPTSEVSRLSPSMPTSPAPAVPITFPSPGATNYHTTLVSGVPTITLPRLLQVSPMTTLPHLPVIFLHIPKSTCPQTLPITLTSAFLPHSMLPGSQVGGRRVKPLMQGLPLHVSLAHLGLGGWGQAGLGWRLELAGARVVAQVCVL